MAIQKFNPRIRQGGIIPFVQINREVIQKITNLEAGFVWVYLCTLPEDWKVVKEHVKKHFDIGEDRLKKIFAYLHRCNLITYSRHRNANGTLANSDILVLSGDDFINQQPTELSTNVTTTGVKNHPMDNHTCGKPGTTKKIYYKEDKKIQRGTRKKRSPLSNDFIPNPEMFGLLESVSQKVGLSTQDLLIKFRNIKRDRTSDDWNKDLHTFLINERPIHKPKEYVKNRSESTGFACVDKQSNSYRPSNVKATAMPESLRRILNLNNVPHRTIQESKDGRNKTFFEKSSPNRESRAAFINKVDKNTAYDSRISR